VRTRTLDNAIPQRNHAKYNSLSEATRSLSQGPRQTISCRPRRPTQNPTLCLPPCGRLPHIGVAHPPSGRRTIGCLYTTPELVSTLTCLKDPRATQTAHNYLVVAARFRAAEPPGAEQNARVGVRRDLAQPPRARAPSSGERPLVPPCDGPRSARTRRERPSHARPRMSPRTRSWAACQRTY
jgi:hypothetical protein